METFMSKKDAGLTTLKSHHSVEDTISKLAQGIKTNGLTEFARIDHGANAKSAGLDLRPSILLIFGNAKGGTPLMQEEQTCGIDLPLKVLCWKDSDGTVWLTYNDPKWLALRHGLIEKSDHAVEAIDGGLKKLCAYATS